jgi:hypothetical protein
LPEKRVEVPEALNDGQRSRRRAQRAQCAVRRWPRALRQRIADRDDVRRPGARHALGVTRARITLLVDPTLSAPAIREDNPVCNEQDGRDWVTERRPRPIVRKQRQTA